MGESLNSTICFGFFCPFPTDIAELEKVVPAANAVVLKLIFGFARDQQVGIGVNEDLVVAVLIGKNGFNQFAQGIGRAGAPGGLPAVCLLYTSPSPRDS